ncbi:Sensor protein ZraS [Aeoliella mucimassa]|uniref:histidine kinase n=2 Tax=Aeoliella mucimassa TaxID=2527972 RepID=A0A518AI46_9BACT|nr:Sensor protein ZraS [Aeoliella mucimassa]
MWQFPRSWIRSLPALLVLLGGITATVFGVWHELDNIKRKNHSRFDRLSNQACTHIQERIAHYGHGLQSLQLLFGGSESVTRDEFRQVCKFVNLEAEFPGSIGIGCIARVPNSPDQIQAFINKKHQDGMVNFDIVPFPDASPLESALTDDLMVVDYVFPETKHLHAIGLDIGSHPARRRAAEQSMMNNQATLTGPIHLYLEPTEEVDAAMQRGFLIMLPYWKSGVRPHTPEDRVASTEGWVFMPLVSERVFSQLTKVTDQELDIQLYNGTSKQAELIFETATNQQAKNTLGLNHLVHLRLGDQDWSANITPTTKFAYASTTLAWVLGLGGTFVTLLLSYTLLTHQREIANAERLANHMTEEIRRLAMVAERTTNGVIITDANRQIVWVNEGFTRITGFTFEEVQGEVPGRLLQCEKTDPQTIAELREAVTKGLGYHGEILNRNKFGREYWIDLEVQPLTNDDNEVTGFIAIESDITSRIQAERKATAFGQLIKEAPQEIYIVDPKTLRFVEVNDGACEAVGYSREELLTMTPSDVNPDFSQEHFTQGMESVVDGDVFEKSFTGRHRRKDGSDYSVHIKVHCATFEDRKVFVAFVTDLSERMKLEQQLAQAQKLESIGQLAAGISHEINTPMQCVVTNVEYLSEICTNLFSVTDAYREALQSHDMSDHDRESRLQELEQKYNYQKLRQNTLEAIVESAEAASRVVEVVRAMKSMSHPGSAERMSMDVNDMIRNAVTVSKNRWKYHATLDLNLDESLPCLPLLSSQMNQVFLNLLVNATDAIADRMEAEHSHELGHIEVASWQESDGIKIRVRDTGCGMSPEVQQRAFDPFFTTKEVGKGTGQGLAISYDVVVKKHKGRIEIESELGKGTAITIWLPNEDSTDFEFDELEYVEPIHHGSSI